MKNEHFDIVKASGESVEFSKEKLRESLSKTGAEKFVVDSIIDKVIKELYQGISTKEIYNRAFTLLKKKKSYLASKYKLKKAIYELGPTGFPFERFVAAILKYSGFKVEVGEILQGHCVNHEVDILAHKSNETTIVECKFHGEQGLNCNVKVPLYIKARYNDVKAQWNKNPRYSSVLTKGWVVTNTRFTNDALQYGECSDLYLMSWDYPKNEGLKDRIDSLGLYPITASTLLKRREKQFLLSRDVVLLRELLFDKFYLDQLKVTDARKKRILNEISQLCDVEICNKPTENAEFSSRSLEMS